MLPYKSLNAATAVGPGESRDLEDVALRHTVFVADTSGLTTGGCQTDLEGSLDGDHWVSLGGPGISTGQTGPVISTASTHLVRFVRVNLTSVSGGRVISAWVASELDDDST